MSQLRIDNITDRVGSSGPIIAGVSTVSSTSHMVMPSGPTEMRGGRGRGVFAGANNPSVQNAMDFVTIATTGNATDFGDATSAITTVANLFSSTRGVFSGGATPSNVNTIQFVEIATTGNAQDFGDCTLTNASRTGASSGHGGLG